tara:strand:+ start:520 stop:651 length:132 start_codon:yes stop_codon:yes gene_type:complete
MEPTADNTVIINITTSSKPVDVHIKIKKPKKKKKKNKEIRKNS